MAQAVKRLFPAVRVAIGPSIEDGFYYDFAEAEPFTPEDLAKIEEEDARDHRRDDHPVRAAGDVRARRRSASSRARASRSRSRSSRDPRRRRVSLYRQGDFIDLCRGPHVPSTGQLDALQAPVVGRRLLARRREQPDAPAHLRHRVPDAGGARRASRAPRGGQEARPPQARASELDLFAFHDLSAGAPFWLPERRGARARARARSCARVLDARGYQEIYTPHPRQQAALGSSRATGILPREHVRWMEIDEQRVRRSSR